MEIKKLSLACALLALAVGAKGGNLEGLFLDDQAALTGGAVVASGSDPGMAWYNPAGLALVENSDVRLGASAYAARYYYVPRFVQVKLPDQTGSIDVSTSSFFSTPSSLVYAGRLAPKLGLALGIFTRDQLDVLVVNSKSFDGQYESTPYHDEQGAELDLRSKDYVAGPALGWQPQKGLRLGLGAFGEYVHNSNVNRYWSDFYEPDSILAPSIYGVDIHSRSDLRFGVGQYSLRGNAGLQWELPGGLILGATFQSPNFLLYSETDVDVVVDAEATTPVAMTPSGIVINIHANDSSVTHPYTWAGPYRGLIGLSKKIGTGFVELDGDFNDLPAEQGSGMVWNVHAGGIMDLSPQWAVGAGVYTDSARNETLTQPGQTNLGYWGATTGLRYTTRFFSREANQEADSKNPLRMMVMSTTLSLHYEHGYGDYVGVVTDPLSPALQYPSAVVPIYYDEYSAHLGAGFSF